MDTHPHFTTTQDGRETAGWSDTALPWISGAGHLALPSKPQVCTLAILSALADQNREEVCYELQQVCYGVFEMSPNNLMKQNENDHCPDSALSFHNKLKVDRRAELFRRRGGPSHATMLCLQ